MVPGPGVWGVRRTSRSHPLPAASQWGPAGSGSRGEQGHVTSWPAYLWSGGWSGCCSEAWQEQRRRVKARTGAASPCRKLSPRPTHTTEAQRSRKAALRGRTRPGCPSRGPRSVTLPEEGAGTRKLRRSQPGVLKTLLVPRTARCPHVTSEQAPERPAGQVGIFKVTDCSGFGFQTSKVEERLDQHKVKDTREAV